MAEPVVVTIEGLDELLKRFGASNKIVNAEIKKAMQKSVLYLQSKVAVYPSPIPPGHWAAHTTLAQKGAFFAQMRQGGWTHRRGTLGRSITSKVKGVGAEVQGIVGTNIPYAIYVIGPKQAAFHVDRWKQMAQHAEEQKGKVEEFFTQAGEAIAKELAG